MRQMLAALNKVFGLVTPERHRVPDRALIVVAIEKGDNRFGYGALARHVERISRTNPIDGASQIILCSRRNRSTNLILRTASATA